MKNEELEYKFPAPYFPDWGEVDEKYNWRAIDANGDVIYYPGKPKISEIARSWTFRIFSCECVGQVSRQWAQKIWRNSLEQRP